MRRSRRRYIEEEFRIQKRKRKVLAEKSKQKCLFWQFGHKPKLETDKDIESCIESELGDPIEAVGVLLRN